MNAFEPQKGIQHVLQSMRAAGIAVTQADFVGHSMGGLLARLYAGDADPAVPFKRPDNLGLGDIHKLITLDSPHLGSELANALVDETDSVTGIGEAFQAAVEAANFSQNFHACRPTARTANFLPPYCAICGALLDLRAGSDVLSQMSEVPVPSHAIVGIGGSTSLNALDTFTQAMSVFGGPASDIAEILGAVVDWYQGAFFNNQPHDLIVSEPSQLGGLTDSATVSIFDVDLPNSYWAVHFTVTGEQRIADEVVRLLNLPALSPAFTNFPAAAVPMLWPKRNRPRQPVMRGGLRISSPRPGTVAVEPVPGFQPARILLIAGRTAIVLRNAPFTADLPLPTDAIAFGIDADGVIARSERVKLH